MTRDNQPDYELLSAYLDGETTATERAQVEQLLAENPEARQMLEQWQAMREAMHSLPRLSIGEDLSQQVLQRAERQMLTEPAAVDQRPSPRGFAWWSIPQRMFTRRNLTWLGLTVSVAVLIVIGERSRFFQRAPVPLAQTPRLEMSEESLSLAESSYGGRALAEEARPAAPANKAGKAEAIAAPTTAPAAVAAAPPREEVAKEGGAIGDHRGASAGGAAAAPPPMVAAELTREKAKAEVAASVPTAPQAATGLAFSAGKAGQPADMERAPAKPDVSLGKAGGGFGGRDAAKAPRDPLGVMAKSQDKRAANELSRTDRNATNGPATDNVLLVYCFLSPDAAKKNELADVLRRQQIVPELSAMNTTTDQLSQNVERRAAQSRGEPQSAAFGLSLQATQDMYRYAAKQDLAGLAPQGEPWTVDIAAPQAKVEAVLGELNAKPESFVSLQVMPSPAEVSQQALVTYNRGAAGQRLSAMQRAGAEAKAPAGQTAAQDRDSSGVIAKGRTMQRELGAARQSAAAGQEGQTRQRQLQVGDSQTCRVRFVLQVAAPTSAAPAPAAPAAQPAASPPGK